MRIQRGRDAYRGPREERIDDQPARMDRDLYPGDAAEAKRSAHEHHSGSFQRLGCRASGELRKSIESVRRTSRERCYRGSEGGRECCPLIPEAIEERRAARTAVECRKRIR